MKSNAYLYLNGQCEAICDERSQIMQTQYA
jgi:hypothetical protein